MKASTTMVLTLALLLSASTRALSQYSSWTAPNSSNDVANPLKGDASATADGKALFNQICFVCHGPEGKGNGVAGLSLNPKPANFLAAGVVNESDGALFWKMTEGKPPMASYKEILTETQRWELVDYIRQLQKNSKH